MNFETFVKLLKEKTLSFEGKPLSLQGIRVLYKERVDPTTTQFKVSQNLNVREGTIANIERGRSSFDGLSHETLVLYWDMYKALDPFGTMLPDY